jgi:cysteinyl-tRNA synthetase
MELKLYNTLTRSIEKFTPLVDQKVGMYACGLTVYNYAHIGNLRTYIFEDVLRRVLEYSGYRVTHIMNITDVGHLTGDADVGEDKMLKSAREKKMSVWEIAEFYTRIFLKDLERLNVQRPTILCKATEHIQDMISLIQRIERNGFTYMAGGNVYFDISKLPDYGKLARLNLEDLKAGARIEVDAQKKNPLDFVLWFTKSKFEHQAMLWDSPWGMGYPGWHIECSAMSMKYLGEHFDIHCGGVDHINVHHTNELAQSEAAIGPGKQWVNYWLHGEFLLLGSEKMAKSSGVFLTLEELAKRGYDALDYRYFLLGAHYRTQLKFTFEALDAAKNSRSRLMEKVATLKQELTEQEIDKLDALPWEGKTREYMDSFETNIGQDLNMPRALSDVWGLLKDDAVTTPQKLKALFRMDTVLGLQLAMAAETATVELDPESQALLTEREAARKAKNFKRSDEIRSALLKRGILVEDTPGGQRWKKK